MKKSLNGFSFIYNIEKKTIDLSGELRAAYGGMAPHFENMPHGFAKFMVHEEDVEIFNEMFYAIDKGELFATADFRLKNPSGWSRVCIFRQDFSKPIAIGIVQDVSERYSEIIADTERKQREINKRIQREREALQILQALEKAADKIVLANLTQNTYYEVNDARFVSQEEYCDGKFDDLIKTMISEIEEEYREKFEQTFQRTSLIEARKQNDNNVYMEYRRMIDDRIQWVSAHVMFTDYNNEFGAIIIRTNIDEQKRRDDARNRELAEALRMAEKANIAKSSFLFNASHDIRTPINAVQGFARIILENVENKELVSEAAHKIQQSGNTLETLINDILELSRIERGKEDVEEQPIDMNNHFQSLFEMFEEEMQAAGIRFVTGNDITHPRVLGDNLKLTRIAMNLLSNAKKFTPVGGTVSLSIKETDYDGQKANYTICVSDTGIGMSKEFQEKAFEQFERERTATESGVTGSGLGLAIIKKLSDLMNGTCTIISELGKGTTVTVSIPLKISGKQEFVEEEPLDYTIFKGKRVLLVEDNEFNREIARYLLKNAYFEVEEAENGAIAVDKLMKEEPGYYDVVLMDIQMPVMDGYKATKEIRNISNPQIAGVPIIAMTANAFTEDKERCLAEGMDSHLAKPLNILEVMKELAKYVKR